MRGNFGELNRILNHPRKYEAVVCIRSNLMKRRINE